MLRKVRDHYWVAETSTQAAAQFGEDVPLQTGDLLTIASGAEAGDYTFDEESDDDGFGFVEIPNHTGRFVLTDNSIRVVEDREEATVSRAFTNSAGQLFTQPVPGVFRGL